MTISKRENWAYGWEEAPTSGRSCQRRAECDAPNLGGHFFIVFFFELCP